MLLLLCFVLYETKGLEIIKTGGSQLPLDVNKINDLQTQETPKERKHQTTFAWNIKESLFCRAAKSHQIFIFPRVE